MLSDVQSYKPGITIAKSRKLAVQRLSIKLMRAAQPSCNRGGCKNHEGRCSMDDAWELANAQANEELSIPEEIA